MEVCMHVHVHACACACVYMCMRVHVYEGHLQVDDGGANRLVVRCTLGLVRLVESEHPVEGLGASVRLEPLEKLQVARRAAAAAAAGGGCGLGDEARVCDDQHALIKGIVNWTPAGEGREAGQRHLYACMCACMCTCMRTAGEGREAGHRHVACANVVEVVCAYLYVHA